MSEARPSTAAVIFSHPPDYPFLAVTAGALLRQGVQVAIAIDQADPAPDLQGVTVLRTEFARAGNLNGTAAALGILETLERQAETTGAALVLKVDSDTWVGGLEWLRPLWREVPVPLVGFCELAVRAFFGMAYGYRAEALGEFRAALDAAPRLPRLAEDLIMGMLGDHLGKEVMTYRPEGPGAAFWNWNTVLTPADYVARFEVVCVPRWRAHGRDTVLGKLLELEAAAVLARA